MDLVQKKCVPCEGGTPPLPEKDVEQYLREVSDWKADGNKNITREYKFKDFVQAMRFVNDVAKIAEEEGHHPDIQIFYNRVSLTLTTHAAQGLTENDFILAAKINRISMP